MNQYTMSVLIVTVVMGSIVFRQWLKMKGQQAKDMTAELSEEAARKIADLEERVRVLERIATNKSSRLSDEIDDL